jgi:predicted anti-sigma-YlaC factor YlaD
MSELTCKELVEVVTDYLEAKLSDVDRRRFEEHLADCRGCSIYLHQMRETIRLTGELREEHVPPEGAAELLRVLRSYRGAR